MGAAAKRRWGLWIPALWYAAVATRGLTGWGPRERFSSLTFDYAKGSPLDRNFFLALIILAAITLYRRKIPWRRIIRSNRWLFWALVLCAVSILWSGFPVVALKRVVKLVGSVLVAMVVLTELPVADSISTVLRRVLLLHIPADIILVKYFRAIGVDWDYLGTEMWVGLTRHKNSLGQVCLTAAVYFIWDILRMENRKSIRCGVNVLYLLMILYLMTGPTGSRSTTSVIVLAIGLITLAGLRFIPRDRQALNRYMLKGAVAMLFVVLVAGLTMTAFEGDATVTGQFLKATGKDTTLTGRTDLWLDILEIAGRNPVLGVGYGSFWIGGKANNLWERHIWRPQEAHNGYLDIYVQLGLVGLALMALMLFSSFRKLKDDLLVSYDFAVFRMVFFLMILVHNMAESSYLKSDHNLWFMFLLIAITVPGYGSQPAEAAAEVRS